MIHLFYFIGILFFIYELHFLRSIYSQYSDYLSYKEFTSNNPGAKYDDYPEDLKKYMIRKLIIGLPMIVWFVCGLMTNQWVLFLAFVFIDAVVLGIIRKIVGTSIYRMQVMYASGLMASFFIPFVIINHYHLHIDILSLIK